VYPNPRVAEFIEQNFVPVQFHIKAQPAMWHRFGVRWTPAILVVGPDGREQYRVEGYLPEEPFLARLRLGLGYYAANRKDWKTAEREFESVVSEFPNTEAAPEAMYWAGVSRYSASHDGAELKKLAEQFRTRYTNTSWAKRASVW